jgi:hypothetical protein
MYSGPNRSTIATTATTSTAGTKPDRGATPRDRLQAELDAVAPPGDR